MRQRFLVPLFVVALKLTHAAITVPYKDGILRGLVSVALGSPATEYDLLLDTGSSNTWVGANKTYVPTSSSNDTGNTVSVAYGSSSFSGKEYTDTVTLSPGLVVPKQSIGIASSSTGFKGLDGILGLGPVDLTQGTVSNTASVPTVTDNLYSQGTISESVVGIGLGNITFGGYDASETVGPVDYVPITATSPASNYWGIDASFDYGDVTILATTSGTVDYGTTLLLIATDAFMKFQAATGGTLDATTGLLTVTSDQYENLKPLRFTAGAVSYTLTPNALIWPRANNADIGGNPGSIYLIVKDSGSNSGSGLDFQIGYRALRRFYTVYDTTNSRVGFATTAYTNSTEN
ncbi:hypothetical protein BGZ83_009022 [Gryganskiella cystojenkinii]|nr:hypothetical protein BGZ83_009022 [Gryganskiella cystojenkinii]